MATYSIKDLEKLSGIKAHTLRIWEKRYNILNPIRTDTNIRSYSDDDLKKVLNISILNRNGVKISKIVEKTQEEINQCISDLDKVNNQYESKIENLLIAMIDLDEELFEKVVNLAIMQKGFEFTIEKIIYPFLTKVGTLWQTGEINPAQEHFISNLIRKKLYAALDVEHFKLSADAKTFVLFLPEGELHEFGLLFYNYLLKKNGQKVYYLGQTVPLNDLLNIEEIYKPDYVMLSMSAHNTDDGIVAYLNELYSKLTYSKILTVGSQIENVKDRLGERIIHFNDISAFKKFISF
jgi:DNA-binding transcriptional MerR regulator